MKIQFLLLQDGFSHSLLGLNVVKGLKQLGINTEYYFPNRSAGKLLTNPDYVFVLKPNKIHEELIKSYQSQNSKIVLIINDQRCPENLIPYFDFYLSPSIGWLRRSHGKPCYLISEEFDCAPFRKIHKDKSLRLVIMSYKLSIIQYLSEIIDLIYPVISDITIYSNFSEQELNDKKSLPISFYKCNLKQFQPKAIEMMDVDNYNQKVVDQFKDYDIGLETRLKCCEDRTSNGVKIFMYAGLPVISHYSLNNENLWFNDDKAKVFMVKENKDWLHHLQGLVNYKNRQTITDFNYQLCLNNAGVVNSAKTFLEAIGKYENNN